MSRSIYQVSLANSLYFSFATFFILWIASILYEILQKTTGQLSLGTTIIIVLSLILILFVIAVTNILLGEEAYATNKISTRILAVFLFIINSTVIIGVFWFVFFYQL